MRTRLYREERNLEVLLLWRTSRQTPPVARLHDRQTGIEKPRVRIGMSSKRLRGRLPGKGESEVAETGRPGRARQRLLSWVVRGIR